MSRLNKKISTNYLELAFKFIRTPFTVASLNADMLLGGHFGPLSTEQRNSVEEIATYLNRMRFLVTEFYVVSRFETGSFELTWELVEIDKIAESALKSLSGELKNKEMTTTENVGADVETTITDAGILGVAINRILENLIVASHPGGEINISLKKDDKYLILGINLFDRELSVDDSIWRDIDVDSYERSYENDSSVNFGLYFMKRILSACGTILKITLQKGEGITFELHIPFRKKTLPIK